MSMFLIGSQSLRISRMAKDHRLFVLIPVIVGGVFLLVQSVLQRASLSSQKSLRFSDNGESLPYTDRHTPRRIGLIWQKLVPDADGGWRRRSNDTSDDPYDETTTSVDFFESGMANITDVTDITWATLDKNDEEYEKLSRSPYIYNDEKELKLTSLPVVQKEKKFISYYIPYDITRKSFKVCRYNRCAYAQTLEQADVIAFKAALIRDHGIPKFRRPKHQRWVMFTSDPAVKNYNLDDPDMQGVFNATCTYRLDSDINWTFGRLRKRQPPDYDYDKIYSSKERLAAWFVSHCQTFGRREEYVRRMQKVFKIDIYGLCSNMSCGNFNHRKDDTTSCLPLLSQKYKFYLSFENSHCEDYVTEKFFKLFKKIHVIPVVRGGVDYGNLFPSGAYINSADFKSPEELAQHLVDLGNDKQRYLKMLKEKSSWMFTSGGEMKHCKLCEYAHTNVPTKVYANLKDVFSGDYPHCWKPSDVT